MLLFRLLAFLAAGFGALLAVVAIASGFVVVFNGDAKLTLLAFSSLVILAAIAFSLLSSGIGHLRRSSRSSAQALAENAAVGVWLLCGALLEETALKSAVGPAYLLIAAALAYLSYRYMLKPAALRAYPAQAIA